MTRNPFATFADRDGVLHGEQVDLRRVADEFGTPVYVYSAGAIRGALEGYRSGLRAVRHLLCYSVKANGCQAILRMMNDEGCGADVTSLGEMSQALHAGIPPDLVVFSGVGKRRDELEAAVNADILMINVESAEELEILNDVARRLGKRAGFAIRINPDIDPKTHPKISTGLKRNKFGIPTVQAIDLYKVAKDMSGLQPRGVASHIGSSLMDTAPLLQACDLLLDTRSMLHDEGIEIPYVDLGGGLGIRYQDKEPETPAGFSERLAAQLADFDGTLILEPGRSVVGNAGVLLSTVLYRKDTGERVFIVLDAAMNDLMRPAMYDARHEIYPLVANAESSELVDIVGTICESSDTFAREYEMSRLEPGDRVAIMSAGAYGMSMASQYNGRPRPAEVLIDGDSYRLVRRRETVEDLWRNDIEWRADYEVSKC